MRIACIGSREIPPDVAGVCSEIGMELARAGCTIVTGTTPGRPGQDEWAGWADGAFATGASYVDPARLIVCLPWHHFPRGSGDPPLGVTAEYPDDHPEWAEAMALYWDAVRTSESGPWSAVRRAPRLRHTRNAGIILQSRLVLACPFGEAEGTRVAMGFAEWRKVLVIDLSLVPWREVLAALLAQAGSGAGYV